MLRNLTHLINCLLEQTLKEFGEYILKLVFDGDLRVLPPTKASPNSKGFILCLKNRGSQNPQCCTLPQSLNEKVELSTGRDLTLYLPDRNMLSWLLTKGIQYIKALLLGGEHPKTTDSVDSIKSKQKETIHPSVQRQFTPMPFNVTIFLELRGL